MIQRKNGQYGRNCYDLHRETHGNEVCGSYVVSGPVADGSWSCLTEAEGIGVLRERLEEWLADGGKKGLIFADLQAEPPTTGRSCCWLQASFDLKDRARVISINLPMVMEAVLRDMDVQHG